jgi:hypothetical protein
MRKHHRFSPAAEERRQYSQSRDRLIRLARRTVGSNGSLSLLIMICRRWGDRESLDAAKAFAKSMENSRPVPQRWRLERILVALTSGASDVDLSAQRLADSLRTLVSERDELIGMARVAGRQR